MVVTSVTFCNNTKLFKHISSINQFLQLIKSRDRRKRLLECLPEISHIATQWIRVISMNLPDQRQSYRHEIDRFPHHFHALSTKPKFVRFRTFYRRLQPRLPRYFYHVFLAFDKLPW